MLKQILSLLEEKINTEFTHKDTRIDIEYLVGVLQFSFSIFNKGKFSRGENFSIFSKRAIDFLGKDLVKLITNLDSNFKVQCFLDGSDCPKIQLFSPHQLHGWTI